MTSFARRATSADLPAVAEMGAALARLHHAWDPARYMRPDGMAEGYRWWLTRELENAEAVVLVGEADGVVSGFAYGRLEERDFSALLDAHGALHDVWVEDRARGGGLGRALVEGMVAALAALGATRVVLKTAAQNEGAQKLFSSLGWRTTMLEMTREI